MHAHTHTHTQTINHNYNIINVISINNLYYVHIYLDYSDVPDLIVSHSLVGSSGHCQVST